VILLSTHIVEDVAELCPKMAILADGKILLEGCPTDLISQLNGQIWRKTVSTGELKEIDAEFSVIAKRLFAGRSVVHVLADEAPAGFEQVPASLEDVYFSSLFGHNHSQKSKG
jgi:ABC-type multidrug transport system ATPase subunit